jgi:hypothetical protein
MICHFIGAEVFDLVVAVRNMVINYPDYLSHFTFIFYSIIKNIFHYF